MSKSGNSYDFLIVGAGIFGVCTAVELASRKYQVAIVNPGIVPHPLAASTDISKIIRMEYGTDGEYMDMAIDCISAWKHFNEILKEKIYHEVGYLVLSRSPLDDITSYEGASFHNLISRGYSPEILTPSDISDRFPSFDGDSYVNGFYHKIGGYAYSGRAVELLLSYAKSMGAEVYLEQTVTEILVDRKKVIGAKTAEGNSYKAGHTIICAGNFTPYLLPELKPYMKVTGHPVFHIKPTNPAEYAAPFSAAFAADISHTGWYGFPLHPIEGVVKVANHGLGLELDPNTDPRVVTENDEKNLRSFLKTSIPSLYNDKIVYTRRCCYTDTLDGHFWIDRHPELDCLTIGTGGSGHGFKMGPEVGRMVAAKALGETHKWSDRYKWRQLKPTTIQKEEARNKRG